MRTLFLGSGQFAVPILGALTALPEAGEIRVLTARPRPAGRRGESRPTPVAVAGGELALPILAPERLRDPALQQELDDLAPDLLLVADYGRVVPAAILDIPAHGALNLHPSLLPRHRGATPVPATILAGDRVTGVSLIRMDEGVDTGPIVAQVTVALTGDEVADQLEARLAAVAARLLAETLPKWLAGRLRARPQPDAGATLTRPLRRADARLDAWKPAAALERQVRAYQPWPGSYLDTDLGRLIVWRARVTPDVDEPAPPGLRLAGDGVVLTTLDGSLELLEVQPAGGRRMQAAAWLRGVRTLPVVLDTAAS